MRKLRDRRGITLTEMLCTVLIVLLLTALLVVGIRFASKTYTESMRLSEAQELCSTLTSVISDKLRFCGTVTQDENGGLTQIFIQNVGSVEGKGDAFQIGEDGQLALGDRHLLGSASYPKGLQVTAFTLRYDASTDIFSVTLDIVARDLTPSMTAGINPENIEGILTEVGGRTSHSAILARAMEVPAVLSIENICSIAKNGDKVVLDGTSGEAILNPDDETVEKFKKMYSDYQNEKALLKEYAGKPSQTKDGVKVELVCNIGKPADANKAVECDGEGIGLFRTEFLFMDRGSMPTEEEQFEAYKEVAEKMKGKPVIIRTLDIGGDKDVPYLGLEHEDNPFLGFRAIRYCLQRKDIYEIQLKALLRASAFGKIKIMVPLVTGVDELRQVKAMIKDIMAELDKEGVVYNKNIEVGVMMETPAACMMADALAKEAAFFSIGTNDLTGYTMAVDRGNAKVAYLYSTYNPAVLRAIKRIIECGKKEGIMVGMCGEAAADSKLIPLLLAFGLDEFSVSATSVLKTRKTISDCTMDECKALADKVMACVTEEEVLEILG